MKQTPPWLVAALLVGGCSSLHAQDAALPGVERLRGHAASTPAERGAILLRELSCTACHATRLAYLAPRRAPDLRRVGGRVTTTWLRRFLADPQQVKPGALMPGCVEDAADVEDLVQYLAARGGRLRPASHVADRDLVTEGRQLFQTIGCAACHAPADGRETDVSSVPLTALATKTTVDELERFLRDPHAVRPSGRMPNLWLSPDEARALAMYLLREQIDNPQADAVVAPPQAGLGYEYFEIDANRLPDFDLLTVKKRGVVSDLRFPGGMRGQKVAVRWRGDLRIPEAGAYVFRVRANDRARLLVNGYVVVADDGRPGKSDRTGQVELPKGTFPFEVQYLQHTKGRALNVTWTEPGKRDRKIPGNLLSNRLGRAMVPLASPKWPLRRDAAARQRGERRFAALRCAACHEPAVETPAARPLRELDPKAVRGCLSAKGGVRFALSATQRHELAAALTGRAFAEEPTGAARVRHEFAGGNCYACHERDGIGGPEEKRYELFTTKRPIDLGDEGKLPPPLGRVGYKLRPEVLEELLTSDRHRIRTRFIATRMPGYHSDLAGPLANALVAADRRAEGPELAPFSQKLVAAGKRIVGIRGFGCVTCHNVNGDRAAGIPGVDIATVARLNPDWFREYLRKPSAFRTDTRMPGFWGGAEKSPLADVLDGTTTQQIDAVWHYLSLGKSMPAPAGVQKPDGAPKAEMIPKDRVIVHRTFMKDVGPRAILAGFPEKLHVAFDANVVRLAQAWRGRFFDASGVASGRSGRFFGPLGGDVLDLPGPAFAQLARADAAWPAIDPDVKKRRRNVGGRFRGIDLAKDGAPTFRYRIAGVDVAERPAPQLRPGGASLRRHFVLTPSGKAPVDLFFRAWRGESITKQAAGRYSCGGVTIRLQTDPRDVVRIRDVGGAKELVVLFVFRRGAIAFEEEIQW